MRYAILLILLGTVPFGTVLGCAGATPAPQSPSADRPAPVPEEPPLVRQHDSSPGAHAEIVAGKEKLVYDIPEQWTPAGFKLTQGMVANYIHVDGDDLSVIAVVGFNTGKSPMKEAPLRIAKEIDGASILTNTTVSKDGLRAGFDWRLRAIPKDEPGVNSGHVELVRFVERPGLTLAFIGYWASARNANFAADLKRMADTVHFTPAEESVRPMPEATPDTAHGSYEGGTVPIPFVSSQMQLRGGYMLLADGGGLHVDLTKGWSFDFSTGDCSFSLDGVSVGGCRMMLLPREDMTAFEQAKMFADLSKERNDVRTTSDPVLSKDRKSATFTVVYLVPGNPSAIKAYGFVEVREVPNAWPEEYLLCAGMWQPEHPELEVQAQRICRSIRPSTATERGLPDAPPHPLRQSK